MTGDRDIRVGDTVIHADGVTGGRVVKMTGDWVIVQPYQGADQITDLITNWNFVFRMLAVTWVGDDAA